MILSLKKIKKKDASMIVASLNVENVEIVSPDLCFCELCYTMKSLKITLVYMFVMVSIKIEANLISPVKIDNDQKRVVKVTPDVYEEPGYDELYGYPSTIGGLIIEGPFAYKNGPPVWTPDTITGAYGLIDAAGDAKTIGGKCPSVPTDSPFANSKDVYPVQLTNGLTSCLLGCNLTQVKNTGVDPCRIGSIGAPLSNSIMSCYDVGPGMAGGYGVCGYNCTAFVQSRTDKLVYCTQDDFGKGACAIYCDSRTFPTANNTIGESQN
jgi:hypothetical protein